MICGKCGKTIPEDAVFCSYCGARYEKKVCKACGTELKKEQLFCHVCGLKWDSETLHQEEQKVHQEEQKVQPEEQKVVPPTGQQTVRSEVLPEKYSLSGGRKIFNIVFSVIYAVLIVFLVLAGFCGFYSYYSWLTEKRYYTYAYEMPSFWLAVVSVIAGIVQQAYIFFKVRKSKNVTKLNMAVSIVLMLLALVFSFLLLYAEGYGLDI